MSRQATLLVLLGVLLVAAPAWTQTAPGGQSTPEPETAPADSSVTTMAERLLAIEEMLAVEQDSLLAIGRNPTAVENHIEKKRIRLQREAEEADLEARGITPPLFSNCENTPEVGGNATVTKVNYYGKWTNTVQARDSGNILMNFGESYDTYRRQDRSTETRNASVDYSSGRLLPVVLSASARVDWSEDVTTNTGGLTNVNARKVQRAGLGVSRNQLLTGLVSHNVSAGGYYNVQNAVNQQQRNDFQEGELNGALRSGAPVAEGVNIATRVYGIVRDGQSALASFESSSSTTGDTLGVGAYYKRSLMTGSIVATQSAFDKRYLDYRRNSNGLIDTTTVPPGASTVVQELEEHDALDVSWSNTLVAGRVKFISKLSHTFERQQYSQSGVGRKDKAEDLVDLNLGVAAGADSFAVSYKYNLKWNDQRIQDAADYTGRQNNKTREFSADWFRDLFSRTTLAARYRTELYQDIAEVVDGDPINDNDRDRLTQELRLKIESNWTGVLTVSLLGEYQTIDDIAIRGSRSANNNVKRTYEVAPSYRLSISPRLSLSQTFRMYIQYQDYDYIGYEGVNKEDNFNKRGNLGTVLTWGGKPTDRLTVDIKHDYNQKFNGTRTRRDAAGGSFYRRDQDQTINRIELGISWKASQWLSLSSATYRTRDVVERFGTVDVLDTRYSGELWVGGVVKHTWGDKDHPLVLDASIRRYLAYGPNVTETSADYWRADVLMKWTF